MKCQHESKQQRRPACALLLAMLFSLVCTTCVARSSLNSERFGGRHRFVEDNTTSNALLDATASQPTKDALVFDANGDGHLDVLLLNADEDVPRPNLLFLNDGKGGWTADTTPGGLGDPTTTKLSSQSAITLDANNDGHTDVLVVNDRGPIVASGSLSIHENYLYLGDGKGGWTRDLTEGGPGDPKIKIRSRGALACDANGDGHTDVLVLNYLEQHDFFISDGHGGWTRDVTADGPGGPAPAPGLGFGLKRETIAAVALDANGDDHADIFLVNAGNTAHELFMTDGNGGWTRDTTAGGPGDPACPQCSIFGGATGAVALDADGDGQNDSLFVVSEDDGPNFLYRGNGRGDWTLDTTSGGPGDAGAYDGLSSSGVSLVDANNDGHADLLVRASEGSGTQFSIIERKGKFELFLGDGKGNWIRDSSSEGLHRFLFEPFQDPQAPHAAVAAGLDVNGDGLSDVLVVKSKARSRLLLGNGNMGGWVLDKSAGGPGDPTLKRESFAATKFDADGDGNADILVLGSEGFPNDLYLADGQGGWKRDTTVGGLADPDASGLRLEKTAIGAITLDANGDGYTDVLVLNEGCSNRWLEQHANITVSSRSGSSEKVGNCPNDLFFGNGKGNWTRDTTASAVDPSAHPLTRPPPGLDENGFPHQVPTLSGATTLDANGDGHTDVFFLTRDKAANELLLGDGNGGWTRDTTPGGLGDTTLLAESVDAITFDANNDGHVDVLVVNTQDLVLEGSIPSPNYLFLGNGKGAWTRDTTAGGPGDTTFGGQGRHGAIALDADGDGKTDVLIPCQGLFLQNSVSKWTLDGSLGTSSDCGVGLGGADRGEVAVTLDANADGNMDILVVSDINMAEPESNKLYLSDGKGNWTLDITPNGPGDPKRSNIISVASPRQLLSFDHTGDGYSALLVTHTSGRFPASVVRKSHRFYTMSCPPGFEPNTATPAGLACVTCAQGFVNDGTTHGGRCVECLAGTASPSLRRGAAALFAAGTALGATFDTPLRHACSPCPPTAYRQRGIGMAECAKVPAGSIGTSAVNTSEGILVNTRISSCPAGQFCPGANISLRCEARDAVHCPPGSTAPQLVPGGKVRNKTGDGGLIDCSAGHFCAAGVSQPCPIGRFQNNTGQDDCHECPAGQFQDKLGQTECLDIATVGFYSSQGVKLSCPPGKYSNTTRATACQTCADGEYQDREAQTECKLCAVCSNMLQRSSCGAAFQGVCNECVPGKFVNTTARRCDPCAEGTYQNETNAASCKTCEACASGARQKCGGAFEGVCGVCPPGNFVDVSSQRCTPCAKGTYQNASNAASCKLCGTCGNGLPRGKCGGAFEGVCGTCSPGHFINVTAQACVPCDAGRFGNDTSLLCEDCPTGKFQREAGKPFCESCPEGFVCDEEAKTSSGAGLLVQPRACPVGKQCNGTAVSTTCTDDGKISDPAGTGQCISCPDLTFADVEGKGCVDCPRDPTDATRVLRGVECAGGRIRIKEDFFVVADGGGGSVAGGVRLGPDMIVQPCREYGVCAAVEPSGASMVVRTECLANTTGPLCASCVDGFGKAVGKCVACPAGGAQVAIVLAFALVCLTLCLLMTKKSLQSELDLDTATVSVLRIGLNFLMMTSFLAALQLDWGSVLRSIFNVAKASSGGLPPLMACAGISFEAEMIFSLLLPLVVPCVPALMLVVWAAYCCARGRAIAGSRILGAGKLHFFVNSSIAVAYLLWPALVVQVLRVLDCSVEIAGDRYVASDVSMRCFQGAHTRLYIGAVFELVAVVPALPVMLFMRLRWRPLGPGTWNRKHLYFLYGGFRPGFEYWEAVVLARKLAVLAVSVFLGGNTFGLQVAAVMWTMCIAFILQLQCKPYQNDTEQALEKLSLGVITVACMVGQLILQAGGELGLGVAGLAICRVLVGAIIMGTFARFVAFFVSEVRGAARRKHGAASGTEQVPNSKQQSQPDGFGVDNPLYSHRGDSNNPKGTPSKSQKLAALGMHGNNTVSVHRKQEQQGAGHV